jgi:hypothetical protein
LVVSNNPGALYDAFVKSAFLRTEHVFIAVQIRDGIHSQFIFRQAFSQRRECDKCDEQNYETEFRNELHPRTLRIAAIKSSIICSLFGPNSDPRML